MKNQNKYAFEKVIEIKRLSKKTVGGDKISFSALVVIGDRQGKVGIGLGKASSVLPAIKKANRLAEKNMIEVSIIRGTIPHKIKVKYGAAQVLLKPASAGTGIIAGGPIRAIVNAVGLKNIVSKMLGSRNKLSNVKATMQALKNLSSGRPRPKRNSDQAKSLPGKSKKENQNHGTK